MKNYQEQLFTNGFCVIDNVIPLSEVTQLRQKYLSQFTTDKLTFTAQEVLERPDLAGILFSPIVIQTISQIIGNYYCMYPDFSFRRGLYIPWHSDVPYLTPQDTAPDHSGHMFQVSLYLQDNTAESGGGLDAMVGSHHCQELDHTNLDLAMLAGYQSQRMPSTAGSLTIWDSRLIHKSSEPTDTNVNPEIKLALQWTVSRDEKFSEQYLQFLQDRIDAKLKNSVYDQNPREMRNLLAMSELRYPDSFSSEQLMIIKNHKLKFKLFQ